MELEEDVNSLFLQTHTHTHACVHTHIHECMYRQVYSMLMLDVHIQVYTHTIPDYMYYPPDNVNSWFTLEDPSEGKKSKKCMSLAHLFFLLVDANIVVRGCFSNQWSPWLAICSMGTATRVAP